MGWGVEGRTQREWLSSACSAGKREVKGGPSCSLRYTIEVHKEGKAKLFSEVHSERTSVDNHKLQQGKIFTLRVVRPRKRGPEAVKSPSSARQDAE